MGAGIGDIRPHIANLVLNDGPFLNLLAATPFVQDAIIELISAAIQEGLIVVPGTGVSAIRDTPPIEHHLTSSDPSQCWSAVLKPAAVGTAPVFRAAGATVSATVGAASALDVPKPAGMVSGDVLFAYVGGDNPQAGILAPGAGWHWATINLNEGCPVWSGIFWRVVDGTEPTNIGFETPGGMFMQGFAFAYSGVDHNDPFNAGPAWANTTAPSGPAATNNNTPPALSGLFDAVGKAVLISGFSTLGGSGQWNSASSPPGGVTVTVTHRAGVVPDALSLVEVTF